MCVLMSSWLLKIFQYNRTENIIKNMINLIVIS
jgi:hypothetical protein